MARLPLQQKPPQMGPLGRCLAVLPPLQTHRCSPTRAAPFRAPHPLHRRPPHTHTGSASSHLASQKSLCLARPRSLHLLAPRTHGSIAPCSEPRSCTQRPNAHERTDQTALSQVRIKIAFNQNSMLTGWNENSTLARWNQNSTLTGWNQNCTLAGWNRNSTLTRWNHTSLGSCLVLAASCLSSRCPLMQLQVQTLRRARSTVLMTAGIRRRDAACGAAAVPVGDREL